MKISKALRRLRGKARRHLGTVRPKNSERELLAKSQLFNAEWYLERYPDIAAAGVDPLTHYLDIGAYEGRSPHPLFDAKWYLSRYPDAVEAGLNPLIHFLRYSLVDRRDPNPLFNTRWYLDRYPDVEVAGVNPLVHYLDFGAKEGRDPNPLFASQWYLKQYPDVSACGVNPLLHYMWYGHIEGRDPNPEFDSDWYLDRNPDVRASGINPLAHYLAFGEDELRDPNPHFNLAQYAKFYPDVVRLGYGLLAHYLEFGWIENRKLNLEVNEKKRVIALSAFEKVKAFDPTLGALSNETLQGMQITSANKSVPHYLPHLKDLLHSLGRVYDEVIVLRTLDDAEPSYAIAMSALLALQHRHGVDSVLLLVVEGVEEATKKLLPPGTALRGLADSTKGLCQDDRTLLLRTLFHAMRPKTIVNIDSRECWKVYARYGKPLSYSSKLYAYLFSEGVEKANSLGCVGAEYIPSCLDTIEGFCVESASFLQKLHTTYGLVSTRFCKFCILPTPWLRKINSAPSFRAQDMPSTSMKVVWCCENAAPADVFGVAMKAPDLRFELYAKDSSRKEGLLKSPKNVTHSGNFGALQASSGSGASVFLYTTDRDRVCRGLLWAASLGMAVVAPRLPEILELIDDETGWPTDIEKGVDGYVDALKGLRENPSEAERRSKNLLERLKSRFTWEPYMAALTHQSSFIEK